MNGGLPTFLLREKSTKWGGRGDGQLTAKQRSALDRVGMEAIG